MEKTADEKSTGERASTKPGSRQTPSTFIRSTERFEIETSFTQSEDEVEEVPIRHDGAGVVFNAGI